MAVNGFCSFTDPVDFEASLHGMLDLVAVDAGQFRARLTFVDLPHLSLFQAEEAAPRVGLVRLPSPRAYITFPSRREPPMIVNGAPLRRGDFVFHPLCEQFYQRVGPSSVWGCISLAPFDLMTHSMALAGCVLAPPAAPLVVRPSPADRSRLLRLHARVVRIAETHLDRIQHPEIARSLEQDIIAALVACLTNGAAGEESEHQRGQALVMALFEEALEIARTQTMSIAEMCARIGVSAETLDACCWDYLGLEPDDYRRLRERARAPGAVRS